MNPISRESHARQINSGRGQFQITAAIFPGDPDHERRVVVPGRPGWALNELVKAGERGFSAVDFPAGIRLAHFVYVLRREYELQIETKHEAHGGPFPGSHARYRLVTPAVILGEAQA
ncbi:winged helix domain-containing protein [Aminobacter aminovorans]|uniref:winged helix domain-containing protein n=1 Tax=Aminobacter aminovorans TaxID=83263 RepID=UPI0035E43EDA